MSKRSWALFAATLVSIIYGVTFTIAKDVMPKYVDAFGFIVMRVGGSVLLFWLISFFGPKEKIALEDFPRIVAAAFFGVLSAQLFDNTAVAVGIAVGVHAGLMARFGYMHPPSGGTALTAILGGEAVTELGYSFMWRPVLLNTVLLVLLAIVINAPFNWRRYPAKS